MHLTHGLHRSLQQTPDAPATISGDRVRTFSEHADRVARVAGGLRDLGVSNGERVAILSQNSDRYCELLNAVPWSDGILNPVNIRWSASEITYSLVDSETAVLVVDEAFVPIVPQLRDEHRGLRTVVYAGEGAAPDGTVSYEELAEGATPVPDAGRRGDDVAAILYTGGTTGFPKGVMLTHANLLSGSVSGQAMSPIAAGGGRVLHAAPLFHLFALAGWMAQSTIGGTHVVVPRFDPLAVLSAIEANRVTTVGLVPTMLQLLVDHPEREAHDTSSLRFLYYGGSAITDAVLRRAMVAFPDTDFVQAYGMTEVAPITLLTADDHRHGRHLRSAGRALVNTEVRIVDGDGNEAARGTVGEIVARGGQLMTGYWGSPEQTSTAIRDGWMHTGDVGSMDEDGYVSIVDRLNDMIITGGENVYSTEVEDAVGRHPAVATCAVVGRPDTRWGERVHALVVLRRGSCVSVDELQDHTRRLIAGYKTPRTFEFVESLPTSGAGKVLKRELRTP